MAMLDFLGESAERAWLAVVGPRGWRSIVGPGLFALASFMLLLYDHLERHVPSMVFWLAIGLIGAVFAWMLETNRQSANALEERSRAVETDQLTGLQNRDCLERDVGAAVAAGRRTAVIVFELDGLQQYNARFGHSAGDQVVCRTAEVASAWAQPLGGRAYRVADSRLAVSVPLEEAQLSPVVLAASGALHGIEGEVPLGRSHGEVALPDEAGDAHSAMQIAEQRLLLHSERQHRSARRQAHGVLMAVLAERRPELREHLRVVAYRAISIARRLGVGRKQLDDIALAAELQDIGLLSVPESVLEKEEPLSDEEREMIHSHPLAGERIIGAAPGLEPVAALVRASSERFDGSGYPDGLSGEGIPIGSRIIAVAVAFAAITSARPYHRPSSTEEALEELRRCAGSQFDPRVVEALAADLSEELAETPPALT